MNEKQISIIKNLNADEKITEKMKYFCAFIGWSRSGHTVIAQLLNKHPNIYIQNEFNYWQFSNMDETTIYNFLMNRAMRWKQNRGDPLIIGGKKGGRTGERLYNKFKSFDNFYNKTIKKPIKWIHVLRNSYDNISRQYIQRIEKENQNVTIQDVIDEYFDNAHSVKYVKDNHECLTVRQEDILSNPRKYFKEMCNYLEMPIYEDHLNYCQRRIWNSPRKTRYNVDWWTDDMIDYVKKRMDEFEFLKNYTFDD